MEKFKVTAYNGTMLDIIAAHAILAGTMFIERTGLHQVDIKSIVNIR